MHSLRNSIDKRLYTWRLNAERCADVWGKTYWQEQAGERVIACAHCPKSDISAQRCRVPFGSPLRQCVTAAQEANLHAMQGEEILEIGFGRHSIPKRLVESAGGRWSGIEPMLPKSAYAQIGKACYGYVGSIPFPDNCFDRVVGIQTLEHWEEALPKDFTPVTYAAALEEVHRVLKPGGSIYFDAPIHLHGHEMFVVGDMPRIRALFDTGLWCNIILERWRENYTPLSRYPTPDGDADVWQYSVHHYPRHMLDDILANRSVWLLTIKAQKAG